jgi:hypothetical protein
LLRSNAGKEGFVADSDDRILVVEDSAKQRHIHKILKRVSGIGLFNFEVTNGQTVYKVPASTQSLENALPLIWERAPRYAPLFRQIGTAAKSLCEIGYVRDTEKFFSLLAIVPTAVQGTNLTVIPPYEEGLKATAPASQLEEIANLIIRGTNNPIAYNSFLDGIEQIGI